MKVCFVTANHPPEAWGGTEHVVVALARELRSRGVEVVVISGSDLPHSGVDVAREEHAGVRVHRVFKHPDEWDRQGFVRPRIHDLVRDILRSERPAVLHVHSTASLGVGITALARELGLPSVMTFHDLWVTCARYFRVPAGGVTCPSGVDRTPCVTCVNDGLQTDPAFVERGLAERDRLVRGEVALAAVCTAPSRTTAAFVRDCLPYTGPIEVIPHGLLWPVDPSERTGAPRENQPLRVGTFGGLVREKGILELLDATKDLGCELHLSGRLHDAGLSWHVRNAQERGQRVVLHGAYTPELRHPSLDLDLAVFPSKCQETYGLVVDEALAHGVPVVVSDQGALRERANTPGVVVTPLANLAKVLRELVTSPPRLAALRAAVPATVPTIAASAQRHLELYRQLR